MLVRLLFASRASGATLADIEALCAHARQHNAAHGITGVLVHGDGVFMQALEGGRQAVNALYAQILRDGRHQDVQLLHYEEIAERCFGGWTMGVVNASRINPATLLKYGEQAALNPYAMPGHASLALLHELAATACVVGHP